MWTWIDGVLFVEPTFVIPREDAFRVVALSQRRVDRRVLVVKAGDDVQRFWLLNFCAAGATRSERVGQHS